MSRQSTRTSSSNNSTATSTPNVPSWLQGPAQNFVTQVNGLMGSGGGQTPISTLQNQAVSSARSLGSDTSAMTDAQNATRGLLGYTPNDVTAGQLSQTDLSPYMNPWTQDVVDASLADIERARQGAISVGQGAATRAGAYGGSRHGVADSLTNGEAFRAAGSTAAGLRSQGFLNAQNAASMDISNRMGADQFNVNSRLAGAGLRLGAANQLGNMGLAGDENQRQNVATQAALGEVESNNSPEARRIQFLQQIAQMLGFNPSDYIGQTVNQSGTSSGRSTTTGIGIGWSPSGGFSIGG